MKIHSNEPDMNIDTKLLRYQIRELCRIQSGLHLVARTANQRKLDDDVFEGVLNLLEYILDTYDRMTPNTINSADEAN